MSDPANPLSGDVWRRGAALGLWWAAIFFAAALVTYAGLAITGWSGIGRALCAMALGPLIASALITGWWLARRPRLEPPAPLGDPAGARDPDRTEISRRTAPLTIDNHRAGESPRTGDDPKRRLDRD